MSPTAKSSGSPTKRVEFSRGTSRVTADPAALRSNALFARKFVSPKKVRASNLYYKKNLSSPANIIGSANSSTTSFMNTDTSENTLNSFDQGTNSFFSSSSTPSSANLQTKVAVKEEEEVWIDIEPKSRKDTLRSQINVPKLKPPTDDIPDLSKASPVESDRTNQTNASSAGNSTSFFAFSPSVLGANVFRKIGSETKKLRSSPWLRSSSNDAEDSDSTFRGEADNANNKNSKSARHVLSENSRRTGSNGSPKAKRRLSTQMSLFTSKTDQTSEKSNKGEADNSNRRDERHKTFWRDPSTPALLAMYVQVGYNAVMVALLLYGIGMFYVTVRNDVNMKVEEYSVDIVNEIAHCSYEYVRNGCEPSKRVPAIEAACRQWERCMQRVPEEVGRARVSAETFGGIIESFLKPIGIKSMIFLVSVFAGSFLLINSVFASRIGPRFSNVYTDTSSHNQQGPKAPEQTTESQNGNPTPNPPGHSHLNGPLQGSGQMSFQIPTQPPTPLPTPVNQRYTYGPSNSFMYTPSHLQSPQMGQPIHANLQSSPIQRQYMNFPY
ncbi:Brr6 protein [Starmerella bacillaris]|uniref:Brr6 protein n=1 Tax=Starmerella bacillaris TaxID=1247836 RepID=A0AAV5RI47_STABA|nr:Brr6 protein [Starmerella bacillaris]